MQCGGFDIRHLTESRQPVGPRALCAEMCCVSVGAREVMNHCFLCVLQALIHGLNRHYYSIGINYRCADSTAGAVRHDNCRPQLHSVHHAACRLCFKNNDLEYQAVWLSVPNKGCERCP
jgi:hypothetical protein